MLNGRIGWLEAFDPESIRIEQWLDLFEVKYVLKGKAKGCAQPDPV